MNRKTRTRRLTPDEAAKYNAIREQVAIDLLDLIARHRERLATHAKLQKVVRIENGEHEARP
ncbi:MAG: hypothetical protein EXS16_17550 [Gemmataceae bacterium]|nr:hypothetical protein [Gemmataceae bacterium]